MDQWCLERLSSCDEFECPWCGCDHVLAVGAGEDGCPLVGVVGDGPVAVVDGVVEEGADGDAAVEVGEAAVVPRLAMVDLGDAAAAGGEGAPSCPAVFDGPALGCGPVPCFASDVEDLRGAP